MKKEECTNHGVGTLGLLLVAFVVLKLCHVISWSWWWVVSPLWIPFAIVGGIIIIVFAIAAIAHLFDKD